MGDGIITGLALLGFGIFYWKNNQWPKVQCALLAIAGYGLGGLTADGLQYLVGQGSSLSNDLLQLLFGVAVPAAVAIAALIIFTVDMLPNRLASTPPVAWNTRVAAVLVPMSLTTLSAISGDLTSAVFTFNNGVLAGLALEVFAIFYWKSNLWPKTQCWLLVLFGWGLGGVVGGWLSTLMGKATEISNTAMNLLFGVAVPSLIAIAALVVFVLDMLPNKYASTSPVNWLTRICAVIVPLGIAAVPAVSGSLMSSVGA